MAVNPMAVHWNFYNRKLERTGALLAGASPSPYYKLGFDRFDALCHCVVSSLEELPKIRLACLV